MGDGTVTVRSHLKAISTLSGSYEMTEALKNEKAMEKGNSDAETFTERMNWNINVFVKT